MKRRTQEMRREAPWEWGGWGWLWEGYPPSHPFDVFRQNPSNGVIWVIHNLVLSELGPSVINPNFRHATSYEFSVYNTDFGEEYGLWPCPVLIRIC